MFTEAIPSWLKSTSIGRHLLTAAEEELSTTREQRRAELAAEVKALETEEAKVSPPLQKKAKADADALEKARGAYEAAKEAAARSEYALRSAHFSLNGRRMRIDREFRKVADARIADFCLEMKTAHEIERREKAYSRSFNHRRDGNYNLIADLETDSEWRKERLGALMAAAAAAESLVTDPTVISTADVTKRLDEIRGALPERYTHVVKGVYLGTGI